MTALPIVFSANVIPTVSVNAYVSAGQIIAREEIKNEFAVNLPQEFSSSHERARKYIKKKPGDRINAGDTIAIKKSFLGFGQEKLVSKVSGIFSRYERDTGNLVISLDNGLTYRDIVSPVEGIVTICDNDKIVIGTDKDVYYGKKGTGGSVTGELFVMEGAFQNEESQAPGSEISLYYALDSRAVGRVVLGNYFPRDLLIKCIGLEAAGIIGSEIKNEDIAYLAGRGMNLPIIETDIDTVKRITQWKNKKIYLNSQEKTIIFLHA